MSKRYILLKDLPDAKAGTIYRWHKMTGGYRPENSKKSSFKEAMRATLDRDLVEQSADWFQEMPRYFVDCDFLGECISLLRAISSLTKEGKSITFTREHAEQLVDIYERGSKNKS